MTHMEGRMSSIIRKGETFAMVKAENSELRKLVQTSQMQAQMAMMKAAEAHGKYLHTLKLFAAVVAQNMQKSEPTIVLHKTIVDQPDTINIAREEVEGGYSYRLLSDSDVEALAQENESGTGNDGSGGSPEIVAPDSAPTGD